MQCQQQRRKGWKFTSNWEFREVHETEIFLRLWNSHVRGIEFISDLALLRICLKQFSTIFWILKSFQMEQIF